jgi:glycosyltransferase involved in cell wall biosynthesis
MISVLFVAAELAPWKTGGISNVVQKLGNALAAQGGVKLTILGTVPADVRSDPPGYHPEIRFISVRRPLKLEPLYHAQLQTRYRSAVSTWTRENPNGVVHFHILPGARAFSAATAALRGSATVVLTHYDWQPFEIPYYEHRWAHRLHWWLSRTVLGRFLHLVANSTYIANAVHSLYPNASLSLIPNGICAQDWLTCNSSIPLEGQPRILHWGILWGKKGVDLLLSAFARLRSDGFPNAHLYIVGDGPDSTRLRRQAADLNLSRSVHFLGPADNSTLRALINGCDFGVFPSAYEGFGIAIMEAMSCGKAVITTAIGGPRDFISNGRDGILVPERTVSSLAHAMAQLASEPGLASRMGQNARQKALRYDWSHIAPQYVELYRTVLKEDQKTAEVISSPESPSAPLLRSSMSLSSVCRVDARRSLRKGDC